MNFIPATKLSDRSYVGLVLSQFLAAFNDQAIHIVAIFFASDLLHGYVHLPGFDQKTIVSIVTACFIAPFFLFSPLAGILADKYSKQRTIVFWKIAEVFITGLALVGFLLPHTVGWGWADSKTIATISAFLVIAAVFLMGTHSAFFVPAKYGIMPEILHTSVLSRGNGILEGTSFVSNILGTSFGGYLYFFLKNRADPLAGGEWVIGLTLFALAWLGMAFAYLVAPIPAASPDRQFTLNPLVPLAKNFGELRRSKPLVLAVVGIAFFTFMTLFVRQTLLFQGESAKELHEARAHLAEMTPPASSSNNPVPPAGATPDAPAQTSTTLLPTPLVPPSAQPSQQLDELWIATLVALVGFGVGGGVPWLAGCLVRG
ncbi:MAG: MFS transporter [Pirellulales bacterium]|nr:MFS transporter [Pirellulales bacterium]